MSPSFNDANDPLVGRVLAERFEVQRRIGEGGHSVIYEANQLGVDRKVALKVFAANNTDDGSWLQRFHVSARALGRIDHSNCVRVLDSGTTSDGYDFIAMELLPGVTLRGELTNRGPVAPARALSIVAQLARGLSAVHELGMIHRDIKPEGVMLCEITGAPELVKLLFSVVLKTSDPDSPDTPAGRALGTPWYLAPEQVLGGTLTPSADIYSAGVVLHEMLTGRRPFGGDGDSAVQVAIAHIKQPPPPLPDAPGLVSAIAMQALAKRPADRFASAAALAEACEWGISQLA